MLLITALSQPHLTTRMWSSLTYRPPSGLLGPSPMMFDWTGETSSRMTSLEPHVNESNSRTRTSGSDRSFTRCLGFHVVLSRGRFRIGLVSSLAQTAKVTINSTKQKYLNSTLVLLSCNQPLCSRESWDIIFSHWLNECRGEWCIYNNAKKRPALGVV